MIYLDNGATSLPKPRSVVEAVNRAMVCCASPGRGNSKASELAEEILFSLRQEAGELFSWEPENVVLTTSATHGLNIAIKTLAKSGSRVVVSGVEHNAVMRPLYAIGARVEIARGRLFDDQSLVEEYDRKLTSDTELCIINHVSNVFGWVQPVEEIARLCRERKIPLIIDASQSAGIFPLDGKALGASFIAMPGHKGLMGPMGTGLLLCGMEPETLLEGGTGSVSKSLEMPDFLPDRLEPGTHNIPGGAGLLAGIRWVRKRGQENIHRHETGMGELAIRGLQEIPRVQVFSGENQSGVVSFLPGDKDCVLFGERLSTEWGIALRAGLHCAPTAHETAGTLETGTIRISPGPFTQETEIRQLVRAVGRCMKM